MSAILIGEKQRLHGSLPKDRYAKKDVAYIVIDRAQGWVVLSQSLPLMTKWLNSNLSSGEKWDTVSTTGLFENMNRTDGRHGGFHKGRFRIISVPLAKSREVFETLRKGKEKSAIVGYTVTKQASNRTKRP
tara:strand:- start:57 stop:449 length:393 start_codon:yes stop_codon:yes gene_type:complete